jgi:MoCo/4Fe-4S cofactor protein with predicted Tat translocation signal
MKPNEHSHGNGAEGQRSTPPADASNETPRYWRSVNDLQQSDTFQDALAREFPEGGPDDVSGVSRRRFLQLMGASVALAGTTACTMDKEYILPFKSRPEGRMPGEPVQYATCIDFEGVALPLLLTSNDGRPTKVEGNPEHPASRGAAHAQAQAMILDLYDPDRSRSAAKREGDKLVDCQLEELQAGLGQVVGGLADGSGVAILARSYSSPTLARLQAELMQKHPKLSYCVWEPLARENTLAGAQLAFGEALEPVYELASAARIVTLDADPLVDHPDAVRMARDFAAGRNPDGEMNRLYAVESTFSNTGGMADHRLPLRSEHVHAFLVALEQLATGGAASFDGILADPKVKKHLEAMGKDLQAHGGKSVVIVGERQPAHVHAIAHRLNGKLGANGTLVKFKKPSTTQHSGSVSLAQLTAAMNSGSINTLLVLDANPVYDAPVDLGFAQAMQKVGTKLHFGGHRDETASLCDWHMPLAHPLESWGDGRSFAGDLCMQQPQILPLWAGISPVELFARLGGTEKPDARMLVMGTYAQLCGEGPEGSAFAKRWAKALHDGFDAAVAPSFVSKSVQSFDAPAPVTAAHGSEKLELVFVADSKLRDGRYANSSWLQETPDFVTKLTWDNALLMGPATAETLGVQNESMVQLKVGQRELEVPVLIQPGQAPGTVTLALGYGRTRAGAVGGSLELGVQTAGFNSYLLREQASMWHSADVRVTPTGGSYLLASTQDHWAIDTLGMAERERRVGLLVREGDLEHYKEHPDFAKHAVHHPPLESLWEQRVYKAEHQWGMTVDLNMCTGCNACVVACTSENNVPVVGKEQVLSGREMHWIRIDRYFEGDPEDPKMVHQPVACVHCENAPCEQVCPVAATTHSEEGTNDMAYNRCVGTRYCANNCPYKVRRFNYFDYFKDYEKPKYEVAKLKFNPEVSVRNRGVMEKCTYCIQRVQDAGITARNEGRKIRDGEVTTACEQSCPTQAITFGDISEPDSRVSKAKASGRDYAMLAELNVKPRTSFLAKVRNPHEDLAVHGAAGHGSHDSHGKDKKGEQH